MDHFNKQPPLGRDTSRLNFMIHAARYDIAGRAFPGLMIVMHEALTITVQEISSGPTQSLFQNRPGHSGMGSCQYTGWMKLDHFQITKLKAIADSHGQTITSLVSRWCVVFIHGRSGTCREQHRMSPDQPILSSPNIQTQYPCNPGAILGVYQF